jgi:hypothetical protein
VTFILTWEGISVDVVEGENVRRESRKRGICERKRKK